MSAVFRGTFIDTPTSSQLRVRRDHVLAINDEGYVTHLAPACDDASQALLLSDIVTILEDHTFLLPTFADLHIHAPQYLYAGTGLDLPLMTWLDKYTYPAEEGIDANLQLAKTVYSRLAERLIENGTGCVVAFGTITVEANLILAQTLQNAGVRAFVGKLSMDQSTRPSYCESSTEASLESLTVFLDKMDSLNAALPPHQRIVQPIITPRFVPTCSDQLLRGLAQISRERGVKIQSHMCESRDQQAWVESTRGRKDEHVFDEAGLLTEDTIQAHVTSFPPQLVDLVKMRGVTVAHCPLSNAYFSDEAFPLREAIDAGVKVGLGSDVAGGYALPIQTQMRQAVVVARLREGARRQQAAANGEQIDGDSKGLRVDWIESLFLATRGGHAAVGLTHLSGSFDVGMAFDAQMISLAQGGKALGPLDLFQLPAKPSTEWWTESVERWWCNGDDRNRTGMWIQGRRLR